MRLVARVGTGVLAASAIVCVASWACLPELAPLPAVEAGVASGPRCGDGVIDPGRDGGNPEQCDPGDATSGGCSPVCTVDCPSGGLLDPATLHCYYLREPTGSLKDAVDGCRTSGGHVVTFASEEEYTRVHKWYLDSTPASTGPFWVGLEGNVTTAYAYLASNANEPGFGVPDATSCEGCFGRPAASSPYFASLDGAVAPPRAFLCVAASRLVGLPWYQSPCILGGRTTLGTICEREPTGSRSQICNEGVCMQLPATNKKYLYVTRSDTPAGAQTFCKSLPSGSLVMFDSREEREQLGREIARLTLAGSQATSTFWIGLAKADANAVWRWDDAVDAAGRPSVWGDFEPRAVAGSSRAFVQMDSTDDYDTTLAHAEPNAANERPYVCQYK